MFDWNDFHTFLAAARAGTLHGAAQSLGVDPATVGRRIARLEASLKATLLVRSGQGVTVTTMGAHLAERGNDIETAMAAIAGATELGVTSGTVRLSAAEGFGSAIVAPALPALRLARPGLQVQLVAQAGLLSPSKREVDIAVTFSAPDAHRLVVEPLSHYALGLYASADYLRQAGEPKTVEALVDHCIVGYIDDLIYVPELRYMDEVYPGLRVDHASTSIRAQQAIIEAGGGIGVLPCFLGQGLQRVLGAEVKLTRRFWLSTHKDVAETARARAVRAWLRDLVEARRAILVEP